METSLPSLHVERFGAGENLCLIHGWGAQNAVWRDWAEQYLAPHFYVHLIELPGFGSSPKLEIDDDNAIQAAWIACLQAALPEKTHLLGWSLGGVLAQQLALQFPQQIQSLVCLATTPKFTQTANWRWAVSPELMADFIKAVGLDTVALLKRFWMLQLQGSDGARQLIKHFSSQMQQRTLPKFAGLIQGLILLRDMDLRDQLVRIDTPTLWLFGENDPLIPQNVIQDLTDLQPNAEITTLSGAAHMPFASHPQQTADAIVQFIQVITQKTGLAVV